MTPSSGKLDQNVVRCIFNKVLVEYFQNDRRFVIYLIICWWLARRRLRRVVLQHRAMEIRSSNRRRRRRRGRRRAQQGANRDVSPTAATVHSVGSVGSNVACTIKHDFGWAVVSSLPLQRGQTRLHRILFIISLVFLFLLLLFPYPSS